MTARLAVAAFIARVVPLVALAAPSLARADAPKVDWGRGLVVASGLGVADRQAPNPAIARGTSRRAADDAGRAALEPIVAALPVAAGGAVGDPVAKAAIAARAFELSADPETDGSWTVTMAVPIEAVRQALATPSARAVPTDGDRGAAIIVVTGVSAAPSVGWTVGGHAAATIWAAQIPAWATSAPHVAAGQASHGAIAAKLPANATDATLFVLTK